MKYRKALFLAFAVLLCHTRSLMATVTPASTVVTSAPRNVVGGQQYYLAGTSYTFRVQAASNNTAKSMWNSIVLQIRDAGNVVRESITISIDTDTMIASTGLQFVGAVDNSIHAAGSLDYDITVKFLWTSTEIAIGDSRVSATVSDDTPSNDSGTDNPAANFGVCASIQVINFSQSGNAADGKINRLHDPFNVTGTLVYNVPTATILDTVPAGEITTIQLWRTPGPIDTGFVNGSAAPNFSFPVPDDYFNGIGLGTQTWSVRVAMNPASGGGTETPAATLNIRCDRVAISNIIVLNGGGVDADPDFWRSTSIPGTLIRVYAAMENGGLSVEGNTVVRVLYNYGAGNVTTDVTIVSGNPFGEAFVTYPTVIAGITLVPGVYTTNYRAQEIIGGPYEESVAGNGQHVNTDIAQDPSQILLNWDNQDPPGPNAPPFTTWGTNSKTADSIQFIWNVPGADVGLDFYTYRLYYRKDGCANPWQIIDRNTPGGVPLFSTLANTATTTITITDLEPLTIYDYYLTAVDVFGNEVVFANRAFGGANMGGACAPPDMYGTETTLPTSITLNIADGITTYANSSFSDINPDTRPLRRSATRVDMNIISGATPPDEVNLILALNDIPDLVAPDYGSVPLCTRPVATWVVNPALVLNTTYFRIGASKTGQNLWTSYIPTTNPLLAIGTRLRFVIETIRGGQATYSDWDSSSETPATANPNNYEYTFAISTATTFTPWPTRILNNVITGKNPVAYPAYYLSEDAYVSIEVYDIKGRPLVKLIDNAFRRGGQNIKEDGWRGDNKAGRKLGIGLYYVHFQAKSVSSGKTILNSFQKVVIAK